MTDTATPSSTRRRVRRRIVEILPTKGGDLSEDDVAHMRKVNGYLERHSAQGPGGDAKEFKWRYSLIRTAPAARPAQVSSPGSSRID